jgi:[histone H3]-lysine36 N-dimethyltransferase SETMAR
MDLSREHFRAMILFYFRLGKSEKECIDDLKTAFGDEAPSRTTVFRWYQEFKFGRNSLSDEFREGRPSTSKTAENVDTVREMIMVDRHVTYREIQAHLGIDMKQINQILHDHLGVKKLCSRWIPHNLTKGQKEARVKWCQETLKRFNSGSSNLVYDIVSGDESWIYSYEPETKQQSTVWVFQDEAKPTKVVRSRSVSKKMIACFVSKTGHVASIPLEDRRTVNAEWYTTICLPTVFSELRKGNKRRRIILHQDNASSHTAQQTRTYLTTQNVELMSHPPYSPDLSPNDFFTFPKIKNQLRGQRFTTPDDAVEAFKNEVLRVPSSEWKNCFDNWFIRMKKCIECKGEYFEKQ